MTAVSFMSFSINTLSHTHHVWLLSRRHFYYYSTYLLCITDSLPHNNPVNQRVLA